MPCIRQVAIADARLTVRFGSTAVGHLDDSNDGSAALSGRHHVQASTRDLRGVATIRMAPSGADGQVVDAKGIPTRPRLARRGHVSPDSQTLLSPETKPSDAA